MKGILSFDERAHNAVCEREQLPSSARIGTTDRVRLIRNKIKEKYRAAVESMREHHFATPEEKKDFLRKNVMFTGNDLKDVIREVPMNTTRHDGSQKYDESVLGP